MLNIYRLALFTGILLSTFSLSAQLSKPHFISVNAGTNIPLNEYKKLDSVATGNAKTGLYYSFEAGVYLSKVFGIGMNVGAFTNQIDEGDIIEQFKRDFSSNRQIQVNSGNWFNGYAMLGPYLSFGTEDFIVDFKILAGVMNSEKPLIDVQTDENGNSQVYRSNTSESLDFGVNVGMHFRIKLVGKLGLRLNAEGMMSEHEFKSKVEEVSNNNSSTTEVKVKKEVEALNLGAGLVLTF
jgi:hypothetical protein